MKLKELIQTVNEYGLPEHLKPGIIEYIATGRPVGGFLEAVFSNDLMDSFGRADFESMEAIPQLVRFIYNKAPNGCHGSEKLYYAWIEVGGMKGLGGLDD